MNQIPKETFCKMIDRIVEDAITADTIQMILQKQKMNIDFFDAYCLFDRNVDFVCELLETMFDDRDGWISYWLFECMGNPDKFEAYDENKKSFYVRDSADLYELVANGIMQYE